ncbi:MAG: bifunctional oligoribonuclease/PAP phosphatase NrnA [Nitrospirota bacterium]
MNKIIEIINRNSTFLITTHINPEGDAIGSELALFLILKKLGKKAMILNSDTVPLIYRFLPHSEAIVVSNPELVSGLSGDYDVLFIVDCGDLERTGLRIEGIRGKIAVIDHHITSKPFGDHSWIEPSASSTGEMIYELAVSLGVNIDTDIAINLYTCILTDTGSFRYSSTTPKALKIAGLLLEKGIDPWRVTEEVYESQSLNRIRLLGMVLSKIEISDDGKIAWIVVTQDMYRDTATTAEDTENFANYPRAIRDVDVSIFFRELENGRFKISFRSKGHIDVSAVAQIFGGGGHHNAAGCVIEAGLDDAKRMVISAVENIIRSV